MPTFHAAGGTTSASSASIPATFRSAFSSLRFQSSASAGPAHRGLDRQIGEQLDRHRGLDRQIGEQIDRHRGLDREIGEQLDRHRISSIQPAPLRDHCTDRRTTQVPEAPPTPVSTEQLQPQNRLFH